MKLKITPHITCLPYCASYDPKKECTHKCIVCNRILGLDGAVLSNKSLQIVGIEKKDHNFSHGSCWDRIEGQVDQYEDHLERLNSLDFYFGEKK